MVMVKCKACGKRYDYKLHGCCPECGAYNRPPQRNRVGADGTVYHMNDSDFLNNSRHRRSSQGGKVCFEQEVCYEEQAKKVRSGSKPWEEPMHAGLSWLKKQHNEQQGKKKKPAGTAIAVAILVSILPTILSASVLAAKVVDKVGISGLEEIFIQTEETKPDNVYSFEFDDAEIGEPFKWWGTPAQVVEVTVDLEETNQIIVLVEGEELWDVPVLCYSLPDGTVHCQNCDIVEELVSGRAHQYYYQTPGLQEGEVCYLEFEGYNGNTQCITTVYLNLT